MPISNEILMQVYNTTYQDSANSVVATYHLNSNSPFYETDANGYFYVLTARFLDWFKIVNGMSYKIKLSWVNPENATEVQSVEYSWTMSLTTEQQTTEEQKTQQEINQGINNLNNSINDLNNTQQETNDFLKDNTYDKNNITDNMPSSDEYSSPTESGFDNIFQRFYNAFTTTETQNVRFEFPNSNGQYIEIPSDLVISKIPQPILFLIQALYWFIFCRFIIKDIAKTAEKAKSGEILDDTSDGNIKTDLL